MATDAQSMLEAASCYECNGANRYSLDMIKLGLLKTWLLSIDPEAMTDAQSLLNESSCYQCYSANGYMLKMIELGLLKQLVEGGGGGGTNACLIAQSGGPTLPCAFDFGLGYDNDANSPTAGTFSFWDVDTQTWIPFKV